ncbi:MAG TPA: flagellar export chaperone FliS [Nocardioides sp.]|nr:flagellar export chaperone FliS [Nocardioides sp.]
MTFATHNPREAYLSATVSTASPAQLLVMLYERLVLDVQRATDALRNAEPSQAHAPLLHAQDIVLELASSLRVDAWDGGPGLAALYDYLYSELVRANVHKNLATAEFCLQVATTLRDTWREAAGQLMSASA